MPGEMARSDPRPSARVTRGAGSGRHLASVLQEGRENANIDAALGFIWGISVRNAGQTPMVAAAGSIFSVGLVEPVPLVRTDPPEKLGLDHVSDSLLLAVPNLDFDRAWDRVCLGELGL